MDKWKKEKVSRKVRNEATKPAKKERITQSGIEYVPDSFLCTKF